MILKILMNHYIIFYLNKWYIDEFYEKVFVYPAKKIGSFFWKKGDIGINR